MVVDGFHDRSSYKLQKIVNIKGCSAIEHDFIFLEDVFS